MTHMLQSHHLFAYVLCTSFCLWGTSRHQLQIEAISDAAPSWEDLKVMLEAEASDELRDFRNGLAKGQVANAMANLRVFDKDRSGYPPFFVFAVKRKKTDLELGRRFVFLWLNRIYHTVFFCISLVPTQDPEAAQRVTLYRDSASWCPYCHKA